MRDPVVTRPVFIFLPAADTEPDVEELVVDPVCGRALRAEAVAGRLLHEGRHHYFCSLRCTERFARAARERGSR